MAEEYSASAKVYPTTEQGPLSILEMLEYFVKHGAMRVSDLHIKVGTPPAYRVDGDLVKVRGPKVTDQMAKQLLYPLMSNENMRKLRSERSVDCSYRLGSLQFRINIFDGLKFYKNLLKNYSYNKSQRKRGNRIATKQRLNPYRYINTGSSYE